MCHNSHRIQCKSKGLLDPVTKVYWCTHIYRGLIMDCLERLVIFTGGGGGLLELAVYLYPHGPFFHQETFFTLYDPVSPGWCRPSKSYMYFSFFNLADMIFSSWCLVFLAIIWGFKQCMEGQLLELYNPPLHKSESIDAIDMTFGS